MVAHLIHIGYPKTGSKFLQRWFAEHPQIAFDPVGIGGCRDVYDLVRQSAAPDPEIRCRVTSFEGLAVPEDRAGRRRPEEEHKADAPDFAARQRACATLVGLFPCAHILLVTRGFRSILLSGYSEYLRAGGALDFDAYFRRPDAADLERGRCGWNYDALIGLYEAAFGDGLIVLPYELLRDDPAAFTGELERRLGLGPAAPGPERLNPSLSPIDMRWYPRLTRLIRRLPVGRPLRSALLRFYVPRIGGPPFASLVRMLHRLRPSTPVTTRLVSDEMLDFCRGTAERLRDNALYAPYHEEYLL
jgi:hypothetical protein